MFCEKSYKASPHDLALLVIVILNQLNIKKKINKGNFKKVIRKKNHSRRHSSNPQCFVRKVKELFPHDLALL
jgi:hypothetical protein